MEAYGAAMADMAAASFGGVRWAGGPQPAGPRDVYPDFNALTLRVVTAALFGDGLGPADAARVAAATDAAFAAFAKRGAGAALPEWLPTPGNAALAKAVADLDGVVYGLIAGGRRRAAAGGCGGGNTSLLDAMLAARDEEGNGMSDTQVRDEALTMLVAGQARIGVSSFESSEGVYPNTSPAPPSHSDPTSNPTSLFCRRRVPLCWRGRPPCWPTTPVCRPPLRPRRQPCWGPALSAPTTRAACP